MSPTWLIDRKRDINRLSAELSTALAHDVLTKQGLQKTI